MDDCLYNIYVDGKLVHKRVPSTQVRVLTDRYTDTNHDIRAEMIIDNKEDFIPQKG